MRRPEVNKFIIISPQPNIYDFSFLAPCPSSGLIIYGKNDELVPEEYLLNLKKRLDGQKNIDVEFSSLSNSNHFFKNKEKEMIDVMNKYIEKKILIY